MSVSPDEMHQIAWAAKKPASSDEVISFQSVAPNVREGVGFIGLFAGDFEL